ncbi:MAG: methyltransferase domain-containing protein [Alphaproteobacteria bacterium]|nr:methyltransferase domain-containing protein [Alphaproteobacteria bacterium]
MRNEDELLAIRAAYAKKVTAGAPDAAVESAFARVRREDFLGPGPWARFAAMNHYVPTPDADPAHLYDDSLFGLVPERGLNNGQPSWHAFLLAQAKPTPGEHIVHIGTGSGYYTAIMAEMVGSAGRVTGIEFDENLAARAKANLAPYNDVKVVAGDGTTAPFDAADVIYINAGATRPADTWLDRLSDKGRLIIPLTTADGFGLPDDGNFAARGAVFLIDRRGDAFGAKWISPVAVFPCAGARDKASEQALAAALKTGRRSEVTRLYRTDSIPDERAFLKAPGWCLAYS